MRDPAIKLFGAKIPLLEEQMLAEAGYADDLSPAIELPLDGVKKPVLDQLPLDFKDASKEISNIEVAKPMMVDTKETTKSAEEPRPEHDHKEANASGEDKALKKPDKILPCPRCDSMDTKFCYYNNYNVNQPRHFCKNCQRYWTAGGTMRNVPIGAGRRKNKHAASSFRHTIVAPDSLASVQIDDPDLTTSVPKRCLKGNSTILKFGPDAPLCESMASMLNLREQQKITSDLGAENREEPSCSSSVTASKLEDNSLPWPQWPYPWNPGCILGHENGIIRGPMITVPAFCAPAFPFPFVPASFWGWSGGPWNIPWLGNGNGVSSSSSSSTTSNCSGNGSLTLGKHSREGEKSLWFPKTLRIDDPDEAAKSSIFATLGIKPDECGKFRAFQSNNTGRRDVSDAVQLLRSNPAALSRSQSFQEAT